MSLRRLVVEMILERGCGTVDNLMPALKERGFTRAQAVKALQNASHMGFLWCDPASKKGVPTSQRRPGVYWPGTKEIDPIAEKLVTKKNQAPRLLVSSVFELGTPKPEKAWPKRKGTIHRPLGEWEAIG